MSTAQIIGIVVFMLLFVGGTIFAAVTGNKPKPGGGTAAQPPEAAGQGKTKPQH